MSNIWLRRLAWVTAVFTVALLIISAIMLSLTPDPTNTNWLWNQVTAIVTIGAPVLGLIILRKQPRHPIGWLWLVWGLVVSFRTLGYGIYFLGGSQPDGYSAAVYFLLWSTELSNIITLVIPSLLMLWFPHGQLLSRRWRILYLWLFLASTALFLNLFQSGTTWNGSRTDGIVINNPYGWLPADSVSFLAPPAFFSLIFIMILAAGSLVLRYRSSGQLVRLQLRWFMLGGFLFVIFNFFPTLFIGQTVAETGVSLLMYILSFSAILLLYVAVGIAILRYRLYDIDVIIRKTVQYGVVTAVLALVYFGTIILLQSLVGQATGEQSPIIIVLSTLLIAAMFNPLRQRVQTAVDRRFYRQKYDAQQVLAQFAQTARDEVEMEALQAELLRVVQETMQPESTAIWIKPTEN
jgi:hypothetical protein